MLELYKTIPIISLYDFSIIPKSSLSAGNEIICLNLFVLRLHLTTGTMICPKPDISFAILSNTSNSMFFKLRKVKDNGLPGNRIYLNYASVLATNPDDSFTILECCPAFIPIRLIVFFISRIKAIYWFYLFKCTVTKYNSIVLQPIDKIWPSVVCK